MRILACLLLALAPFLLSAEDEAPKLDARGFPLDPYANETKAARDARMAWFREARFGLFIHWGLYAVPAGIYKGEPVPGIGEWIMLKGEIPVDVYKAYAKEFNPTSYDPEAWAQLAKRAGMRYLVITSKHHDGFALFPSAVTDWDIEDASPYGKDLIGPLAEAARAEGLKFGLYYSQTQDWMHPGGSKSGYRRTGPYWDEAQAGDFNHYLKEIAIPQVGEILGRYQPDVLWWDTPMGTQPEQAAKLAPLLRIVPGIIHNNRLGGGFEGDTETPEQHIPARGLPDRDWEVCMTMNDTWGYKRDDDNWKSTGELIRKLSDIVSKGGNFLLNIGPKADGTIPQPSVERLEAIGAWMDVNGDAIYGTSANPFHRLPWGRATQKTRDGVTSLFLHVFDWPKDGELVVPGLNSTPEEATLLEGGQSLSGTHHDGDFVLKLRSEAPDPHVSVIRLQVNAPLHITPVMPSQDSAGQVILTPAFADIHNRSYSEQITIQNAGEGPRMTNWENDRSWVSWIFSIETPGTFEVAAEVAATKDANFTIGLADQEAISGTLSGSGDGTKLVTQSLGQITVSEPGEYQLELRPVREAWSPVQLGTLHLRPAKSSSKGR